jgi:hypothetical protein
VAAHNGSPLGWLRRRAISAFLFPAVFLPATALSLEPTAQDTFKQLHQCIKSEKLYQCREDITADSVTLYDRFDSYGLVNCLPDDITFVSEKRSKEQAIVRAKTTINKEMRFLRLVFSDEEGRWKFDIPSSLKQAIGDDWENKVKVTEQLYLVLRKQFGNKLDCASVRALVGIQP